MPSIQEALKTSTSISTNPLYHETHFHDDGQASLLLGWMVYSSLGKPFVSPCGVMSIYHQDDFSGRETQKMVTHTNFSSSLGESSGENKRNPEWWGNNSSCQVTEKQWLYSPLRSWNPGGGVNKEWCCDSLDLATKHQHILKGRSEHIWQ